MIHNDAHAGHTVPLGIRGRGTALNRAGWPTEVQAFYVPDPDDPADDTERKILDELRPPLALCGRGIIMPPPTDLTMRPLDFTVYQGLPLLKAADYPQFDPHSQAYKPPSWMEWVDHGVDSIFGTAPSIEQRRRPHRQLHQRGQRYPQRGGGGVGSRRLRVSSRHRRVVDPRRGTRNRHRPRQPHLDAA